MCLYPRTATNKKFVKNKKNGGFPPPVLDERTRTIQIPCGNCIICRKKKAREWQARLLQEVKDNEHGKFITLTFSNESIAELSKDTELTGYTLDNYIATKATRLFLERWRKKHKKSLRHWLVTELGHQGTENIHIHGIIWFDNEQDLMKLSRYWQYGWTYNGDPIYVGTKITGYNNYVNDSTVGYICKYVTKMDNDHRYYKSKILASPGIGRRYHTTQNAARNAYRGQLTNETYRTPTGHKIALPQYYRQKIYNDQQREQLWIQKMDKGEYHIMGRTVHNLKDYWDLVLELRKLNAELHYGDDTYDPELALQQEQARQLLQQLRTKCGGVPPPAPPEVFIPLRGHETQRPKRPSGPGSSTNKGAYAPSETGLTPGEQITYI